jgi:hypothetical protein
MAQPTKETSTTGACSVPAPAIPVAALTMPLPPDTLLAGVEEAIAGHLGISNLRHRSAVYKLERAGGVALVSGMFDKIRSNYSGCGATTRKNRSSQNWRWQSLQPQIGADNRSSEVIVERAIADRLGKSSPCRLRLARREKIWTPRHRSRSSTGAKALRIHRAQDCQRHPAIRCHRNNRTRLLVADRAG